MPMTASYPTCQTVVGKILSSVSADAWAIMVLILLAPNADVNAAEVPVNQALGEEERTTCVWVGLGSSRTGDAAWQAGEALLP